MTSFEWLVEPTVLARALAAAGVASSTLAIDVGCGASDLARALREELKCPHVLAVDVDATLVAARADESCVCDVSDPDQTAVAPGSADLVVVARVGLKRVDWSTGRRPHAYAAKFIENGLPRGARQHANAAKMMETGLRPFRGRTTPACQTLQK